MPHDEVTLSNNEAESHSERAPLTQSLFGGAATLELTAPVIEPIKAVNYAIGELSKNSAPLPEKKPDSLGSLERDLVALATAIVAKAQFGDTMPGEMRKPGFDLERSAAERAQSRTESESEQTDRLKAEFLAFSRLENSQQVDAGTRLKPILKVAEEAADNTRATLALLEQTASLFENDKLKKQFMTLVVKKAAYQEAAKVLGEGGIQTSGSAFRGGGLQPADLPESLQEIHSYGIAAETGLRPKFTEPAWPCDAAVSRLLSMAEVAVSDNLGGENTTGVRNEMSQLTSDIIRSYNNSEPPRNPFVFDQKATVVERRIFEIKTNADVEALNNSAIEYASKRFPEFFVSEKDSKPFAFNRSGDIERQGNDLSSISREAFARNLFRCYEAYNITPMVNIRYKERKGHPLFEDYRQEAQRPEVIDRAQTLMDSFMTFADNYNRLTNVKEEDRITNEICARVTVAVLGKSLTENLCHQKEANMNYGLDFSAAVNALPSDAIEASSQHQPFFAENLTALTESLRKYHGVRIDSTSSNPATVELNQRVACLFMTVATEMMQCDRDHLRTIRSLAREDEKVVGDPPGVAEKVEKKKR